MLGWLHQALASERELILALLDPDAISDIGHMAIHSPKNTESDSAKSVPDTTFVLDRIFEGACWPLKIRVEQVLQSQPGLIVSYKLTNMLDFYSYTISELLDRETALCNTIRLLKDAAQQTFFNILKTRGEKLFRYPPLIAVDLSPPPAVREGVPLLLELIDSYNSMMLPASGKKPDFYPVITAFLDPIVQMCERAVEAHKSKGPLSRRSGTSSDLGPGNRDSLSVDALLTKNTSIIGQSAETASHIYFINCLSAIRQPLIEHEVAVNYVASLSSTIETQVRALVNKEVDTILRRCGLLGKISYIPNLRIEGQTAEPSPLAEILEFSPPAILECLRSFFGVVTGNEGSLPEFEQLQGPRLRSDATLGVARALADAYELLYQAIVDPKSGYPDPKSLVRHSPDQIRRILEI